MYTYITTILVLVIYFSTPTETSDSDSVIWNFGIEAFPCPSHDLTGKSRSSSVGICPLLRRAIGHHLGCPLSLGKVTC